MDFEDVLTYAPYVGILLTIGSFLAYIFATDGVFIFTFAVGIALMIGTYIIISIQDKKLSMELEQCEDLAENNGYIVSLDGPYVPSGEQATIEEL